MGIHSILPCLTCPINNLFASSVCCTQLLNYSISFPLPTEILAKKKFGSHDFLFFSRFYDAGLIKMYFEILVFVASLQTLALSATISTSHSEISNDAGAGALTCTSEREVCLPANYSKFQLPNKGKQTVVSIGEYSSRGLHNRPQFSAHSSKLRLSAFHLSRIYGHFYGVNFGK